MLGQIAASVPGLKVHQLLADRSAGSIQSQGDRFDQQGDADKVPGTPSLFIGKTGTKGTYLNLSNPDDYQTLAAALDAAA
jgi:hypothetical protein